MKKKLKTTLLIGGFLGVMALVAPLTVDSLQHTYASTQTTNETADVKPPDEETQARLSDAKPISILLTGLDSGALMYKDETGGRTDAIMVVTLNPDEKRTTITSIPRDTWMPIDEQQSFDKANHAYAKGGIEQTETAIENYVGIPIDYVVNVDMKAFIDGVDALGGLELTPNQTFSQDGSHFTKGERKVYTGEEVMNYARMRKQDENGEIGRQERQRQVINEMMEQYLTVSTIKQLPEMIEVYNTHVETNLDLSDLAQLFFQYQDSLENISAIPFTQYQNVTMNGSYYLHIDDMHRNTVHKALAKNLEIEPSFNPIIYPLEQIPQQAYFETMDINYDGIISNSDLPVPAGLYSDQELQQLMHPSTNNPYAY